MTAPETRKRPSVVLASASRSRRALLAGAGIDFSFAAADIDERALEASLGLAGPADVAKALSEAKALAVSRISPGAVVIGADQTLGLGDRLFHKPASPADARGQLQDLRGQTHTLYSGVACAFDGDILFSHVSMARMSMRAFTDAFLDHYMETVGDSVLASVGCYQLEGPGIQLFEAIDGDYFTILGLPLLPLLTALREFGCIDD